MLFSVLIYASEDFIDALPPEELATVYQKHGAFHEHTKTNNSFAVATKLMSTGTSVTINRDKDDFIVTDGPFAETKEQFMGFYVIDCPTLEDAIEAVKILPLDHGRIGNSSGGILRGSRFQECRAPGYQRILGLPARASWQPSTASSATLTLPRMRFRTPR